MSYISKRVWTVIPKQSYKVIRNCSKCSMKSTYINTGNFRINANGNYLDIWLIYQCEKCKNTFNLSIYERISKSKVPKELYQKFLSNDTTLALEYGLNQDLFSKNKAELKKEEFEYDIKEDVFDKIDFREKEITIKNPYRIRLRLDKIISKQLDISRVQVKKLIKQESIFHHTGIELSKLYISEDIQINMI